MNVDYATGEIVDATINYAVHPAATLFPLIEGKEFDALVEDIRTHGQMEPIVLDSANRLIDGRNRARACQVLGMDVDERVYDGDDVTQFVISHNLHRRHLTDGQRAMVAAKIATGRPGQWQNPDIRVLPPTQTEAASLLNVGTNQVEQARKVVKKGTPGLVDLVEQGKAPVTTAARVATELDVEAQDEYVSRVNDGMSPTAAAPPDLKQQSRTEAKRPPKAPRRVGDQNASQIEAMNNTLNVWREHVLPGITELDASVTEEKAIALSDDLSKAIQALRRINNLLKERTK